MVFSVTKNECMGPRRCVTQLVVGNEILGGQNEKIIGLKAIADFLRLT